MCPHLTVSWLTIVFMLITSTIQVEIKLYMDQHLTVVATCHNLPPGWCCKNPSPPQFGRGNGLSNYLHWPFAVEFNHLHPRHLAAAFTPWNEQIDCDHLPPVKSKEGPGTFIFTTNYPVTLGAQPLFISGASYVQLPNKVPETVAEAELVAVQGLLGLRSLEKSWTAPGVHMRGSAEFETKSKRDIFGVQKGDAYIGPPPRGRFPDIITVNGTNYRSTNTSALDYRNADGELLDISDLGF